MKRKMYEKPSVEVVELKQTVMLMTSPVNHPDYESTEW
jgi:hypothetical protein